MSELNVATITGCQNAATAWCSFDGGAAGPITPRDDYNVDDITDNGTGDYTVNFTNALSDANYSVASSGIIDHSSAAGGLTVGPKQTSLNDSSGSYSTGSITVECTAMASSTANASAADGTVINVIIFGGES